MPAVYKDALAKESMPQMPVAPYGFPIFSRSKTLIFTGHQRSLQEAASRAPSLINLETENL